MKKTLIFIPTYNEKDNVEKMAMKITGLGLRNTTILFMDDNSPDGTGNILDRIASNNKKVQVKHRKGKLGIGSAHLDAISYAYKNKYTQLITLDCDFTHNPLDIPKIIKASNNCDVVITSRYKYKDSLKDWNIIRKSLTKLGHVSTKVILGMDYDATGAFRLYRLENIPQRIFKNIKSYGYSFFYESLYLMYLNGVCIKEIPIRLPKRTYGSSKMKISDVVKSVIYLFTLRLSTETNKKSIFIDK